MQRLTIVEESRHEAKVFRLKGPFNEEVGLFLIPHLNEPSTKCIFNFKEVTAVNSNGLRAWVLFLRDFTQTRQVVFEELPSLIVDQLNMVPSFGLKAEIKSVFVPYTCDVCVDTTQKLIAEANFPAFGEQLALGRCKKCAGTTQPSDESEYFAFFHRRQGV